MPKPRSFISRVAPWSALVGGAAILFAGLFNLARLTSSTSYPAFSSLRSAPDGTKLLFQSLAAAPELEVERNYLPLDQLRAHEAVILVAGASFATLQDASVFKILSQLAEAGNRIALAFAPFPPKTEAGSAPLWDIHVEHGGKLLAGSKWHRQVPDLAVRKFGNGSVTLILPPADITNSGLVDDVANRAVVNAVLGSEHTVVFEESHLGVVETGSVMGLARHYHLTGLLCGLIAFAILFIWREAVAFPPSPRDVQAAEVIVTGGDPQQMLAGLLARHLRPDSLVSTCLAEWKRTSPRAAQIPSSAGAAHADPVAAYRQIQADLTRKKIN